MHIDEFASLTKKEVDEWVVKYKKEHDKGSKKIDKETTYAEAYPLDMDEGEWFEMFIADMTNNKSQD